MRGSFPVGQLEPPEPGYRGQQPGTEPEEPDEVLQTAGNSRKRSRRVVVGTVLLAAALLYVSFRGVDWGEMARGVREARLRYLGAAFLILSLSYLLRALRWRVLLAGKKAVSLLTSFWASEIGYLGNSFLPARAGDVIRTIVIARATGISASYALATVVTERIMDVLALVVMSVIALAVLPQTPTWLFRTTELAAAIAVLGVAGLFVAPRLEAWLGALLERGPLPAALHARLMLLLAEFLLGLRTLRHGGRALSFGVLTVTIWFLDASMVMVLAHAFGLQLVLPQSLLLLAALGLASSAPSTPGYVGMYQFVAVNVLTPFDFTRSQALLYILAFQAVMYAVAILWGGLGLWRLREGTHA